MELIVVIKMKRSGALKQSEFWKGVVTCEASFKKQKIKKFKHLRWVPKKKISCREDIARILGSSTDLSLYVAVDEYTAMYGFDVRPFALIKLKKGLNAAGLWVDIATSQFGE